MKVILLKDVPKVGQRYDVKDFADGYAQNVLINKGLAMRATPAELAKLAERKAIAEKKRKEDDERFKQALAQLNDNVVTIQAKANDKGHLFKSVSAQDILKAISGISAVHIDESEIHIDKPIKEIGIHKVQIKNSERSGSINIKVESI